MEEAIERAELSPEGGARVGAVIARGPDILVTGHKGELGTKHAEECALDKAAQDGIDLNGSTACVTLEPCHNIRGTRVSCAERLADAGITRIFIGQYDNNHRIYRQGWRLLRDFDIECRDFTGDLRQRVAAINSRFASHFTEKTGLTGRAKFDFEQNGGKFVLRASEDADAPFWRTGWTGRGAKSIYANGGTSGSVALAKYATQFEEIDDPAALDWGGHSAPLDIGDIAVFRNENGFALCRLEDVEPTVDYGGPGHTSVTIDYELRPFES